MSVDGASEPGCAAAEQARRAADLALALEAAGAAGALAAGRFGGPLDVSSKGALGPVTDVDLAVDALLKDVLRSARPDYGWLSEETAVDGSRLERARTWVVDPIDGTRAFVNGKPHWAVCIGLLEDGLPTLGVVINPVLEEAYHASVGAGAFLNGAPIRVASTATLDHCRMLGDAQMFKHPAWPSPWPPMQVEQRNSIAYRMCLVASGAFDAAVALSAKNDWDLAAADIIVREAGGIACDHTGLTFRYDRPQPLQRSLVASGSALHPLLIERMDHIILP